MPEGPSSEQVEAAIGGTWWFVLVHDTGPCLREGKTWALQMQVTDGLVPKPQMMMCTSCANAMSIGYSGPTPPGNQN